MNSAVWVREIWDTRELAGDVLDARGRPRWQDWEGRFDPEDLNALETALQLKESQGGSVTGLSVGPVRKMDVLRECLYRGVDQTIRLAGDDEIRGIVRQAHLVAAALSKLDEIRVLLIGIQLNEGETAQRAAMAARILGWPLVSYVEAVESVTGQTIRVRRAIEGGIQVVEVKCPVVISIGVALVKEDPRAPRSAKAKLKLKHKRTPIPEWGAEDLGDPGKNLKPPEVVGYHALPQREFPSKRVSASDEAELRNLIQELQKAGVVR